MKHVEDILTESFHPAHPQNPGAPATADYQQPPLPTGPARLVQRTQAQIERNRAFLAAAGRVEFGRYEATSRAIWIAFAYFASLGVERICYATVEHVAERAKVSARTVQRHIPALIEQGRIYAENRVGGRTPSVWKIILPDELITPGVTGCHPRGDRMSDDIRDRTLFPGRAAKLQARPGGKGVKSDSSPVSTATPPKGAPVPAGPQEQQFRTDLETFTKPKIVTTDERTDDERTDQRDQALALFAKIERHEHEEQVQEQEQGLEQQQDVAEHQEQTQHQEVAPPSTDPRASGYGCEVCTDTGMCPGDDGRVRRCDCFQTNPVILARQADRRRQ